MTATLITLPFRPTINLRGGVEPGAILEVYASGTLTPVSIFADSNLTTPLSNPLEANAFGVFPDVYFDDASTVRVVIKQANGTILSDTDPYVSNPASAEASADAAATSAAAAEAVARPVYADNAAGLAATSQGDFFFVNQGDGTADLFRHDAGPTATAMGRSIIIDPQGSGAAALIGSTAGTVQSDINARPTSATLAATGGAALVGYTHGGSGASARTVQDKLREAVSAKDYGAAADGVADDYAELANAYAATRAIHLPYGTYKIDTDLTISAPVSILADDQRALITNKGIFINASGARGGLLSGFSMDGPNNGTGVGVKITNGQDISVHLRRVRQYQYGADLNFAFLTRLYGGEYSFNTTGIRLKNFSNNVCFFNVNVSNNDVDGIEVQSSQGCSFVGCNVESNAGWGIVFDNTDNSTLQNRGHLVSGGYFESNVSVSADGDFYIGRASHGALCQDVIIQGVMHLGQKDYGYYVDYATNTKILYPTLGSATFNISPIHLTANSRNTTIKGVAPSQITAAAGATVSIDTVQYGTLDVALDGSGFGDGSISFPIQYNEEPPISLQVTSDSNPSGSCGTASIKNGVGTTGVYVQVHGGPGSATVKVKWMAGR